MGIFNFFGTSAASITSNSYANGYLTSTTYNNSITSCIQTPDYSEIHSKTIFSKYYPVFSDFSKREPTTIEINDVYFKIINETISYTTISYEKQLERNQAIFDLIKGNSAIWLIYSKSEDTFISHLAQLFINHIPI